MVRFLFAPVAAREDSMMERAGSLHSMHNVIETRQDISALESTEEMGVTSATQG